MTVTTRPAAIKEFSDAVLRLKWAVQDARLSVAERRELDNSITDLEVAHAERLRVALEPDPVEQRPPSYGLLMEALGNLHQHATHIAGSGRLVELIHAAHMASLEYAKATRWAPPTDKWSAAARAVMDRSTPAEGTPVVRSVPGDPDAMDATVRVWPAAGVTLTKLEPVSASGLVALDLSDCEDVP